MESDQSLQKGPERGSRAVNGKHRILIADDHTIMREGLRAFVPAEHRIATVGVAAGVTFIDDSKATNAHAALTSLLALATVGQAAYIWHLHATRPAQENGHLRVDAPGGAQVRVNGAAAPRTRRRTCPRRHRGRPSGSRP